MKRELTLLTTIGGIAASGLCGAQAQEPTSKSNAENVDRPNILFILSDDHTSQAWGVYGGILSKYVKNENIRKLANQGCVLENCFCTNSISVPSRASILTGKYSHQNGIYSLDDALSPDSSNIAKTVKASGYQTALIGKWHLKKEPSGFDYFAVFHDQGEYRNPVFKMADCWVDDDKGSSGKPTQGFSTDIVTDSVIHWIKNRDKNRPFLTFCHFKATHEPWDYPERMAHLYDDVEIPEPDNLMEFFPSPSGRTFKGQSLETIGANWAFASKDPSKWWCRYPGLPFTTEGLDSVAARKKIYQKYIKDYLRCGATIDDNIGRLLHFLDKEGISDNTIVIYVADQGFFLGEHGFYDKRLMYEESLRMPFVIRYPKEIPAGTRNHDIILNTDFAALLADYAQAKVPEGSHGKSFRDNLKRKTPKDWRKSMYYRYWTHHEERPAHLGIRNDRYKLIFFYGNRLNTTGSSDKSTTPAWEFYDLKVDPHENHNSYSDLKYAKQIRRMKEELLRLRAECGDTDASNPTMKQIMDKYYW
jgi:Arylsulfatase A and related enzymes